MFAVRQKLTESMTVSKKKLSELVMYHTVTVRNVLKKQWTKLKIWVINNMTSFKIVSINGIDRVAIFIKNEIHTILNNEDAKDAEHLIEKEMEEI